MKKIVYFILMLMIVSCSSHRKISDSSNIKATDNTSLISQYLEKSLAEDIDIEWTLEDDSVNCQINNSASCKDSIKPPKRKPPKKGKMHIRIAKHENITSQHIAKEKKVKRTEKNKTEEKQNSQPNVKKKNYKILVNSIIIIIFGFFVKYLFSHKKSLKKIWNKIKNSLTLRHP